MNQLLQLSKFWFQLHCGTQGTRWCKWFSHVFPRKHREKSRPKPWTGLPAWLAVPFTALKVFFPSFPLAWEKIAAAKDSNLSPKGWWTKAKQGPGGVRDVELYIFAFVEWLCGISWVMACIGWPGLCGFGVLGGGGLSPCSSASKIWQGEKPKLSYIVWHVRLRSGIAKWDCS